MSGATRRGLDQPRPLDGLRQLAAVAGAPEALHLWAAAAHACDLHGLELSVAQQLRVVDRMTSCSIGPTRMVLVGWAARLRLHQVLERSS